jgi:hypothetical protein
MGMTMSRQREHTVTEPVYNPDLEFTQQDIADQMHGRGAAIGSVGMSGGQFPTKGMDAPGYGTGTYDDPYDPTPTWDPNRNVANSGYYKPGLRYNRPIYAPVRGA